MTRAQAIRRYTVPSPLGPVTLASDETLVSIEPCPVALPRRVETPIQVLLRMAGVESVGDLGTMGPVIASAANQENAGNPELRRYEAKFGRDALYAAEFLSALHPQLEMGTVRYLSAYQATVTDDLRQAEPGKVPNHIRDPSDPLARRLTRETGRRWPWYGATDATVQFISAACRVLARSPAWVAEPVLHPFDHPRAGQVIERSGLPLTYAEVIRTAAQWLVQKLHEVPGIPLLWARLNRKDSFTVWTDSPNAFHHRDGILATPPVAPVQLQSQAHEALTELARQAAREPLLRLDPQKLDDLARSVRRALLDRFVVEDDRGTFLANGVEWDGGRMHPLRVRTVNMGFVLDSEVLAGREHRALRDAIVRQLFGPEMSSPFGFAGRARDELRFEPFDYHAQVWGFAVHKIARGLARHGYRARADEANDRVLRQTAIGLFPENVGAQDTHELKLCEHVLTVARPAADGRRTITVKERPPAPYAAWTVAATTAIQATRAGAGARTPSGRS